MRKILVFAMVMGLGVSTIAFAANPFSDVPQNHWAYGAIAKLASEGVVTGYPDGTFKGNIIMTRYEMAQIVAKALSKGVINENDALVVEFVDELDNLGVRVNKLERKADNVKITGSMRYRYFSHDYKNNDYYNYDQSELRTRIGLEGFINDNWTYQALIENDKNFAHNIKDSSSDDNTEFRRAWLKGSLGQVGVTAGHWDYNVLNGNVFDEELDGAKLDFNAGNTDLSLAYGRFLVDEYEIADGDLNLFIATASSKFGAMDGTLAYYNLEVAHETGKGNFYTIGLSGDIAKDLNLGGTYIKSDIDGYEGDDNGYALSLNYKGANKKMVGSYGLYAMYNDQPRGTYIVHTTDATTFDDGFKGYTLGLDYTVAKNLVATINYFDTEAQEADEKDKVIMSQMYVFF
jgi:hypothetical protein